ncbi:hypothetical protein JCM8547_004141 [Rhodosporidiobolus lusitaniae]
MGLFASRPDPLPHFVVLPFKPRPPYSAPSATFASLPPEIHFHVLSLVEPVKHNKRKTVLYRCCLVSKYMK